MLWKIIGICAAILTMFSFVPQIIKVKKTKSAKDVSLMMLFQLTFGVAMWIVYGVYLKDAIIILANSITLVTLVILLVLYFTYERQKIKV